MYPQYLIALIPANAFKGDEIEGYIGICRSGYYGVVSTEEKATRFASESAARRVLNGQPDALFDRYHPQIVLMGADQS